MASEIVRPDGGDAAPDPNREVEFALMLSRVIDSVERIQSSCAPRSMNSLDIN